MRRGEIVLVKFPFTDLSTTKVRPALVISSNKYNRKGEDAIFICISSLPKKKKKTDISIKSSDNGFLSTGLKKNSVFRTDKIVILKKSLAVRKLGEVPQDILQEISSNLADILGLSLSN